MEYVYHGSKTSNLKELTPHESTHGNYVYATKRKEIAIIMSRCCGGDSIYSLYINNNDGSIDLIERVPLAFDKMFANSFSLYTLDATNFKDINTGFDEVVSDNVERVLKEEQYPLLRDVINELAEQGLINLYFYPERPQYIPNDDHDLIDQLHKYANQLNHQFTHEELYKWIFLHPNLEEDIRLIAKEQGIDLSMDYDEIKYKFIELQNENPNHQFYIDNGLAINEYFNNKL
ncbi:MAG: hypothetical protein J5892_03015 [Bacilli bacterium]|nr:hypothetical protein [Bacilli bacterium]